MQKSASLSPNKYKSCIKSAATSPKKKGRVAFAKNLVKVARLSDNDSYVYEDPEDSIVENRNALRKMYNNENENRGRFRRQNGRRN
jgi:hypothetical protein